MRNRQLENECAHLSTSKSVCLQSKDRSSSVNFAFKGIGHLHRKKRGSFLCDAFPMEIFVCALLHFIFKGRDLYFGLLGLASLPIAILEEKGQKLALFPTSVSS